MGSGDQSLSEGRAALARGDWASARSIFAAALEHRDDPEAQYGLARALEWSGDYRGAIGLYEQAYAGFRATGEVRRPALIAGRELCFLYAAVHGDGAVASGWLARAQSLALTAGDCQERGWVALGTALMADDLDERDAHVGEATRIAQRLGDADLEFCAMAYRGLSLVLRGHIADGMRCVDESAAAANGGEVSDYLAVGEIYCKMLVCCELVLDVRRAEQWMAAAAGYDRDHNAPWISAICRMHYGGILIAAGRWGEAEHQLSTAVVLYDASYQALRGGALVRLADLRARQGRFGEAARLLTGLELDSYAARPLARLHLADGETEVAAAILRRFLAAAGEGVLQTPELALLAEVELAAGRPDLARGLLSTLQALSAETPLSHVRAFAAYAAGVVASATGNPDALSHLETAVAAFAAAGLPLEEARARLAIATIVSESNADLALAEARAAFASCQRLDAAADADAAANLLRRLGSPGRQAARSSGAVTKRESEVLQLLVEGIANEQIARRLFISKRTVEHHVSSILAKLGVSSRAEAVAHALRHGSTQPLPPPRNLSPS